MDEKRVLILDIEIQPAYSEGVRSKCGLAAFNVLENAALRSSASFLQKCDRMRCSFFAAPKKGRSIWMNPVSAEPSTEVKAVGEGVPFERIRRITGYLVGTMDKWNDAKRAEEYFKPGDLITLEGYIRTGSYEDKNGVKRYTTEIYAEHAGFPLGGKNGEGKASGGEKQASPGINPDDFEEIDVNDDLPF